MPGSTTAKVTSVLEGACLLSVARLGEHQWSFAFDTAQLGVECLWRAVSGGRIAFTCDDDGQKLGLPRPMDVEVMARELFAGRRATVVRVGEDTADLVIFFGEDLRVELLATSAGYEAWQLNLKDVTFVGTNGRIEEARQVSPGLWIPTQQG